jgi:hypothetical protein
MTKYNEYVQTEKGFVYERENTDLYFEWDKIEIDFESNYTSARGVNGSFAFEKHPDRDSAIARFHQWVTEVKETKTVAGCNS